MLDRGNSRPDGLLEKFHALFTWESSLLGWEPAAVLFWISMKCEHSNVGTDAGLGSQQGGLNIRKFDEL